MIQKMASYIGFCLKSAQCVIGQDRIKSCKDKIHLIILCPSASRNLTELALNAAEKKKCCCIKPDILLENLTHIENCKIIAITNPELALAILDQNDYTLLRGGYIERRQK